MKYFKPVLIIVTLCIFGCHSGEEREMSLLTAEKIDALLIKKTFNASNGLKMPYRLFNPININDDPKPLLVFLHGRGDRGSDNDAKIYREAGFITNKKSLLTPEMQSKYPCYILIPQCSDKTENEEWAKWIGNTPETPFKGLGKDGSYTMSPKPSDSGKAALELIEEIVKTHAIDGNRIYLIGISMGGFGTWEFITRKPELFAAAIPMAGYSDTSQIKNIQHIPIWIFHGSNDQWNPVEGSRNMYKLLQAQNADVTYTEYENTGHVEAFKKAFAEKQLIPWLFSKSKQHNTPTKPYEKILLLSFNSTMYQLQFRRKKAACYQKNCSQSSNRRL